MSNCLLLRSADRRKRQKVRAEWQGGKLLREIERSQGKRTDLTFRQPDDMFDGYLAALREVGFSEPTAHRWQVMSLVPEPQLEEYFARQREKEQEITAADVYRRHFVACVTRSNEAYKKGGGVTMNESPDVLRLVAEIDKQSTRLEWAIRHLSATNIALIASQDTSDAKVEEKIERATELYKLALVALKNIYRS